MCLDFPSSLHEEITVQRCCDADYPPVTSHKDRVHGQKEHDSQVHAWELREKLHEEQKSQSKHRANSTNLETTLGCSHSLFPVHKSCTVFLVCFGF